MNTERAYKTVIFAAARARAAAISAAHAYNVNGGAGESNKNVEIIEDDSQQCQDYVS